MVRHAHSRWGPVTGVAATWRVSERWRLGLTAGIIGNYAEGRWVRRGVLPIAQWQGRDSDLVWEFALGRNEQVTLVGVNLKVPVAAFATTVTTTGVNPAREIARSVSPIRMRVRTRRYSNISNLPLATEMSP